MSCNLHKQNENLEGHKPSSFMDFSMSRGLISWKKKSPQRIRNPPRRHFFQTSGTFYSAEIHQVLEIPSLNLKMFSHQLLWSLLEFLPALPLCVWRWGNHLECGVWNESHCQKAVSNHQPHLPLLYKQLQALRKPGIFIIKHHLSQFSKLTRKLADGLIHSLSQILSEQAFKGSAN